MTPARSDTPPADSVESLHWFALTRPNRLQFMRRLRGTGALRGIGLLLLPLVLATEYALFSGTAHMLHHILAEPEVGVYVGAKLLSVLVLTMTSVLLLSNVITGLAQFYLARDLELLRAAPLDWLHFYLGRLVETAVHSSWMVLFVMLPMLAGFAVEMHADLLGVLPVVVGVISWLVIASTLGVALTTLVVLVVPARKTRDLMGLMGIVVGALVVLLLRLSAPERLTTPEGFRDIMDFTLSLRMPSDPWLPTRWISDVLWGSLRGRPDWLAFGMTAGGAASLLVLGAGLHRLAYDRAFTNAAEGGQQREASLVRARRGARRAKRDDWFMRLVGTERGAILLKDGRMLVRDPAQWSQLLLLVVLVAVYLYNIQLLPVSTLGDTGRSLAAIIAFCNIVVAGFVLAAIASRFLFPALSAESPMLWLWHASPVPFGRVLRLKVYSGLVPLLAIALLLTEVTNAMLGVDPGVRWIVRVTIVGITSGLAALAVAFGVRFPVINPEHAAQVPTSTGGMLFMISAIAYLAVVMGLEATPMHRYLVATWQHTTLGPADRWLIIGMLTAAALVQVGVFVGCLTWMTHRAETGVLPD